jgi:hypothetical protein
MILLKKNTSRFVYYDDGISLAFGSIQWTIICGSACGMSHFWFTCYVNFSYVTCWLLLWCYINRVIA